MNTAGATAAAAPAWLAAAAGPWAVDGVVRRVRRAPTIRPLQPDDAPLLAAFVRELAPASRYARFHAGVRELSPSTLDRLTHIDPRHERALVATRFAGGREVVVGEARYALVGPDDEDAGYDEAREFAVAVADDERGSGIGTALLGRLIAEAARSGVTRLIGDLIRDNLPMLALARKLGFTLRRHPGDARLQRVERELAVAPLHGAAAHDFEIAIAGLQMKSAALASAAMVARYDVLMDTGQVT